MGKTCGSKATVHTATMLIFILEGFVQIGSSYQGKDMILLTVRRAAGDDNLTSAVLVVGGGPLLLSYR